jgi:hypothetical protein
MTSIEVQQLVSDELGRIAALSNFHGISINNVSQFLTSPEEIWVDPDDPETEPRCMWLVLRERPGADDGYVVVFDPTSMGWCVAEPVASGKYLAVVWAASLGQALDSM